MNWKTLIIPCVVALGIFNNAHAQFWNGQDSLYGQEWINFDQTYFKFKVAEDGVYRLTKDVLEDAGFPVAQVAARHLQVWRMGQQIPVISTTDNLMTDSDHLLVYGYKNRGEFDTHLFPNGIEDQLNPDHSMFTDSSTYFVTWNTNETGLRFSKKENDLNNLPPVDSFFWDEVKLVYDNNYYNFCQDGDCFIRFSHYDRGEGWAFQSGSHVTNFTLYPKFIFPNGPDATLITRLTNNLQTTNASGVLSIYINDILQKATPFSQKPTLFSDTLSIDFEQVRLGMEMAVAGQNSGQKLAISTYSFIYPREFKFERDSTFTINLQASAGEKHIYAHNFRGGELLRVWDFENNEYIEVEPEVNFGYRFRLSEYNGKRKIFLQKSETTESEVASLQTVNFRDYSTIDPNYIIISHPRFMNDGQGNNFIVEYAQYRASTEGGDYTPVIVPITTLTDQFAYGIENHPSSIRHFIHWAMKNWSDPQHVFLIGKGVVSNEVRKFKPDWQTVPTFGSPGSDMLLTSDHSFQPLLPIGRIPIVEASEIKDYLDKVKTHEERANDPQTIEDRTWAKRVVHLSGGDLGKPAEIINIRNGLDSMKDTIEKSMMAPQVYTFQKKTSGNTSVSDNARLTNLINDGVSLVTYFGHSGVQILDFQIIDDVNTLPPTDRYHVFMAMGCYAGDIFDHQRRSYSESWALAPRKGSIAFIANSSAGFIPTLRSLGNKIYDDYGNLHYREPIGISINKAQREFIESKRNQDSLKFDIDVQLAFSLNICGDPAISLINGEGEDYTVDPNSVGLAENIITVETDSLTLSFDVVNLGKYNRDSLVVTMTQTLPSGQMETLKNLRIPTPRFRDSLTVRIPNLGEKAAGFNRIDIVIDSENEIDELPGPDAENNNSLSILGKEYLFFVAADDARPIFPLDFSIIGETPVTLAASTSEAHLEAKSYVIEIDTTEQYNSAAKRTTRIRQTGGILTWSPPMSWQDEQVYYWRVSPDSTGRGRYTWRGASFVYLEGQKPGWNQSHYYQFVKDDFTNLEIDETTRKWQFSDEVTFFKFRNATVDDVNQLRPVLIQEGVDVMDYYDYSPLDHPTHTWTYRQGVYVSIFDGQTGEVIQNPSPGAYGSRNITNININYFAFNTANYEDRVGLMDLLTNGVKDGDYVAFFTIKDAGATYGLDQWATDRDSAVSNSLIDILESKGATMLDELQTSDEVPYIFFYREGNPDYSPVEGLGENTGQIELNATIMNFAMAGMGSAQSTRVGPAREWESLIWDGESEVNDKMNFVLLGIQENDQIDTLLRDITTSPVDLSSISSDDYPHVELKMNVTDTTDLTSPQLNHWRITYTGLPDLAIDLTDDFYFYNDTMQQGEDIELRFALQNMSQVETDSVLVRYTFINSKNEETVVDQKLPPLQKLQTTPVSLVRSTSDLEGDYRLVVNVNPDDDQAEINLNNNSFVLPFTVISDRRNPLLDVTFDGVHILDGDLVSAHPEINIRLTDENEFLALSDTSLFDILLQYPNGGPVETISFQDADVTFNPGTVENNTANVVIRKKLEVDGQYTLIVRARDGSGNQSGDMDYQISFEVINEVSISEVINYPNPFSTSTRFVYTLTGDRPPAFFKIQIMTMSGKVVREISDAEIGPLKVGQHMTDYVYDGTDEFGERLANGVYLYRLIARDDNGDEIKHRDVGISEYFKKGWGKMVILR